MTLPALRGEVYGLPFLTSGRLRIFARRFMPCKRPVGFFRFAGDCAYGIKGNRQHHNNAAYDRLPIHIYPVKDYQVLNDANYGRPKTAPTGLPIPR
jgi:hypothetical protein